jgi:hypothetical protein
MNFQARYSLIEIELFSPQKTGKYQMGDLLLRILHLFFFIFGCLPREFFTS